MIVDQVMIDRLVEKSQDTVNCQAKESIEKHVIDMLQKNGSAKLTINLDFALTGRKLVVKGDSTVKTEDKYKDTLMEFVVDDQPDLFDQDPEQQDT